MYNVAMDTIATWLTLQLQHHDLNALRLSYAIGVSHVTIGKWLKGIYTPNSANCRKLARVFNIPEDDVLVIAGHRSPDLIENTNYHVGPRALLDRALDQLTSDQLETLIASLEIIK